MKLTWDEVDRQITLEERGLDFTTATEVFDASNFNYTTEDVRYDYGEKAFHFIRLHQQSTLRSSLDPAWQRPTYHFNEEGK